MTKTATQLRLQNLECQLHALIRSRVGALVDRHAVPLPRLADPLPLETAPAWFPVPGMYGGFRYWAEGMPDFPTLVCESWSRAEAGSGQRHAVTESAFSLLDGGFV